MTQPPEPPSFAEDLAAARKGDREAIARLVERVDDQIRSRAQRALGPAFAARTRASDLVQDAYLRILRSLDGFTGTTEAEFAAWVLQVFENSTRQELRYLRAEKRRPPTRTSEFRVLDQLTKKVNPTPPSTIRSREQVERLERALDTLSEDHRRILEEVVFRERRVCDVAEEMGRSDSATRMLLSRARAALALAIEREGGEL